MQRIRLSPSTMNILITGASRGIGKAIALKASAEGHTLALVARSADALLGVETSINNNKGTAKSYVCDVTSPQQVASLHQAVISDFGGIDAIINNAGIAPSLKLEETTDTIWRETFDTNVSSAFYIVRAFIGELRNSNDAHIINIASTAASEGFAYTAAYTASKHALLGFSRAIAKEFFRYDISVATLCPGFVRTSILDASIRNITSKTGKTNEEAERQLGLMNISGNILEPDEIATAVINLLKLRAVENGQEMTL